MRTGILASCLCLLTAPTLAQTDGDFDACGVLSPGNGCVLFVGGGGSYVIAADAEGFGFGDPVRVVGTLDTTCITICPAADGCIRGATLYNPAVFPCGTALPDFPGRHCGERGGHMCHGESVRYGADPGGAVVRTPKLDQRRKRSRTRLRRSGPPGEK